MTPLRGMLKSHGWRDRPGLLRRLFQQHKTRDDPQAGAVDWSMNAALVSPFGSLVALLPCDAAAEPVVLGRGSEATVRVPDQFVDPAHARVRWDAERGVHVIEDIVGVSGTYLDGERVVSSRALWDGAVVTLGKTPLIYRARVPVSHD